MNKLAEQMVHLPNAYTFRWRFIEALQPSISIRVLELGYNTEQLDEAKLYTSVYNKAASQGGNQQWVVQTTQSNRVPVQAGIWVSRASDNKAQPGYRQTILAAISKLLLQVPYPIAAKLLQGWDLGLHQLVLVTAPTVTTVGYQAISRPTAHSCSSLNRLLEYM
jgi:hypothetical protein